jgi:hypothetical protein
MAEILNVKSLLRKLEKYERESTRKNNGDVIVGYAASYAVYVHENLEARHKEGKRAKFLEQPFRMLGNGGTIARIVVDGMKNGASLIQMLLVAGMRVQRESQKIVPVDTGNLKGSAFTAKE